MGTFFLISSEMQADTGCGGVAMPLFGRCWLRISSETLVSWLNFLFAGKFRDYPTTASFQILSNSSATVLFD
jgi:hypothetical protein